MNKQEWAKAFRDLYEEVLNGPSDEQTPAVHSASQYWWPTYVEALKELGE